MELICIRETMAPGFGYWKEGDKVTDPELVERFVDNPNFQQVKEEN